MFYGILLFLSSSSLAFAYKFEQTVEGLVSKRSVDDQSEAVMDLIGRVLGEESQKLFRLNIDPSMRKEGKDSFKLTKGEKDDKLTIEGSSGVAASWGLNHYLKYYCHVQLSWETLSPVTLPARLPPVDLTVQANDPFRYYQNVCTWSYSFVWWDWGSWERHLDWMALNGVNMALAFSGQEHLWRNVYSQLGLTKWEIDEHFTGPAFLAWLRMGNTRGWGGPLPPHYELQSVQLNQKILERMRSLGMLAVLPAFSGQVPRGFERVFPNANLTKLAQWNNFEDQYCCPYLLSPEDPLFKKVGALFMNEVITTFGTDHVYSCDTFNEMVPSSGDLDYIRSIGVSIFDAMKEVDSQAMWLMQGWMFVNAGKYWTRDRAKALLTSLPQGWLFHHEKDFWTKERARALLTSVPSGRMIVLDLHSEYYPQYKNLDSYFGQPFIWCMLHNFGGTLGMHGSVEAINKGVFEGRSMINSTMIGTGLTPEGINQNYVIYDLMLEMGYRTEPVNLTLWFENYAVRRYGEANVRTDRAWQLLKSSVYNYTGTVSNHGKYIMVRTPALGLDNKTWYEAEDVYDAWEQLLWAADSLSVKRDSYIYDLVDLTRQALQIRIDQLYLDCLLAFNDANTKAFQRSSASFNGVMEDLERVLASDERFLLGGWIQAAKSYGSTPLEITLLERNARNQVTLWGPDGQIKDYANKQWSGLVGDYYAPRWKLFWSAINASLVEKSKFRPQKTKQLIFEKVEQPFTYSRKQYSLQPKGDPVLMSKELFEKWRPKPVAA